MSKKAFSAVAAACVSASMMGCPSDTSNSSGGGDPLARAQTAIEKYMVDCRAESTAAAKNTARNALVNGARIQSLPGLKSTFLEYYASFWEQTAASCADPSGFVPAADMETGTLANGEACFDGVQCVSGACKGGSLDSVQCGVCAQGLAEGDTCASESGECGPGLKCAPGTSDTNTRTCVKRGVSVAVGADCAGGANCVKGASCRGRSSGGKTTYTCVVDAARGQSCADADCEKGNVCNLSRVCVALPKLGEDCTGVKNCGGGARCDRTSNKCVDGSVGVAIGEDCGERFLECVEGSACFQSGTAAKLSCVANKKAGESCGTGADACGSGLYCNTGKVCASDSGIICPLK